ncbi:MAG: 1-(5-phosphoribosyl)-5-[(5-phosphoribosylamino)methylideneamino]imidazole-4-carboxamide isomerase [Flammeovirgaceae bacterium]
MMEEEKPFYIIPAIDLIDGKCVRLKQGDYNQKKVYNENPLEVAKSFEDAGIKRLHLVDLDGAKAKRIVNWKVLERIASHTRLKIDFGGGLRSNEDLMIAFNSGAYQITGGSIAVKSPETFKDWLKSYGADRVILGSDAKSGKIAINGWQEGTDHSLMDFLKDYVIEGVKYTICTDIDKDGMEQGPSFQLYQEILSEIPSLKLIASGGVTSLDDLVQLKEMGLYGAVVGKAIYEGKIQLKDLASFA